MPPREEQYPLGDDGLVVERVGAWAKTKHKLLTDYIQASGGARSNPHFVRSGAAYIDVFCGPGRLLIRDTKEDYIDGSPVAAFKQGLRSPAPFSSIEISDFHPKLNQKLLDAAEARLGALKAPVVATPGPALEAMERIVQRVHSRGLHFAFLDPHNLGALSFELFKILARLENIDILVHVSIADLRRNVDLFTDKQFDTFAPGWSEAINFKAMNKTALRSAVLNYWYGQVAGLGLTKAKHSELIKGTGNQHLYWLSLLSRHPLAHKLWNAISSAAKQPDMF
jgi:three-Cys-motif partner protein